MLLPIVYVLYDNHIFRNIAFFALLLFLTGIGFLTPVEIKKPDALGKIAIIVLGVIEAAAMVLFMGWDAV